MNRNSESFQEPKFWRYFENWLYRSGFLRFQCEVEIPATFHIFQVPSSQIVQFSPHLLDSCSTFSGIESTVNKQVNVLKKNFEEVK